MPGKLNTTLALVFAISGANFAYADAGHHKNKAASGAGMAMANQSMSSNQMPAGDRPMMGGDHHDMMHGMMKMMMQMHGGMMNESVGMMGAGTRMGMMDRDVLKLMHGQMGGNIRADTDGNGEISAKESGMHMRSMLTIADQDGDGAVTLAEFEEFHNMMMKNRMVDRFQHLDANGDGKITESEITAPANRMEMGTQRKDMMEQTPSSQGN